jgi:hypothetical protein
MVTNQSIHNIGFVISKLLFQYQTGGNWEYPLSVGKKNRKGNYKQRKDWQLLQTK